MGGVVIDERKRFSWIVRTFFIIDAKSLSPAQRETVGHLTNPAYLAFFGVLLLILAAIFWYVSRDPGSGVPPYQDLKYYSGEPESITQRDNNIRFRLRGNDIVFRYSSKSSKTVGVRYAIDNATIVGVKYQDEGPKAKLKEVFEMMADGRVVRSYQDIMEAWKKDDKLGPWLSFVAGLAGIYLLLVAYYTNLNNKFSASETP
ncbi:MAG: hypothetical protein HKN28_09730 [Alphaproteobacteria bacterium]|nr:hypothetical protein [Alphaproteobacteria bacterium]